jgi:hypothetical protein
MAPRSKNIAGSHRITAQIPAGAYTYLEQLAERNIYGSTVADVVRFAILNAIQTRVLEATVSTLPKIDEPPLKHQR